MFTRAKEHVGDDALKIAPNTFSKYAGLSPSSAFAISRSNSKVGPRANNKKIRIKKTKHTLLPA